MHMATYKSEDDIVAAIRARVSYDVGQSDIAQELGISQSYLSELLSGKKSLGPLVLKKLGFDPKPHFRKAQK
jgi:predicted transcriptional regulator